MKHVKNGCNFKNNFLKRTMRNQYSSFEFKLY